MRLGTQYFFVFELKIIIELLIFIFLYVPGIFFSTSLLAMREVFESNTGSFPTQGIRGKPAFCKVKTRKQLNLTVFSLLTATLLHQLQDTVLSVLLPGKIFI